MTIPAVRRGVPLGRHPHGFRARAAGGLMATTFDACGGV